MRPSLLLLLLTALTWGCDSGSEDPQLEGRFTGGETVRFSTVSGDVDVDFDIDLDIDAPGQSGAFTGDATIARGAAGFASATTGRGTVSGTLAGASVSFSAIASSFTAANRRAGDGLRLDAEGTFASDGTLTLQATMLDFAYGRSEPFRLVLEK